MVTVELLVFSLCVLWTGHESHCDGDTQAYKECHRQFGDGTRAPNNCNPRHGNTCILVYCSDYCIPKPCRELYPPMEPLGATNLLLHALDLSLIETCATRLLVAQALVGGGRGPSTIYEQCLKPALPSFLDPNPSMGPVGGHWGGECRFVNTYLDCDPPMKPLDWDDEEDGEWRAEYG